MDYKFMEFLARKLGVTKYQVDFYNRVQEIIPNADLDITDFCMYRMVNEKEVEACNKLGIAVRPQCAGLAIDRSEIWFYLHKTVSLETIFSLPDPEIFGPLKDTGILGIYIEGYTIPAAQFIRIAPEADRLSLCFPDASRTELIISSEERGEDRLQLVSPNSLEGLSIK